MSWLKIKSWLLAMVFATSIGGAAFATVPQTAAAADCNDKTFLTMPVWYRGIAKPSGCELKSPADFDHPSGTGLSKYITIIVLNVIEIALNLIGYIAVGFILYGGFMYMIAAGSADKIVSAKKMILNAIIGLIISFFSVVIVQLIVSRFH